MELVIERRGDVPLVTVHGRVGELEAHELDRELMNLIEQGAVKIVIDLADVPYATSTCLGAMMVAHKRVREKGGYVRVARPQPLVRQILEITKLTKLFGCYASVEDALAAK